MFNNQEICNHDIYCNNGCDKNSLNHNSKCELYCEKGCVLNNNNQKTLHNGNQIYHCLFDASLLDKNFYIGFLASSMSILDEMIEKKLYLANDLAKAHNQPIEICWFITPKLINSFEPSTTYKYSISLPSNLSYSNINKTIWNGDVIC